MNRRILLVASAASALLAAAPGLAQQSGRTYRLGLLGTGPTPTASRPNPNVKAFRSALRELGYIEGRNLVIEEAQRVTRTTPIVMGSAADPVAAGLIASLGRPAGNVTGLTLETPDLIAKRLELLKETLPALRRIGAFYPGEWRSFVVVARWIEASQAAARELGLPLEMMDLSLEPERWDAVFREAAAGGIDAVMVMETGVYFHHGARLAQACVKNRLPGIFPFREQAEAGGLMAYGANVADLWRRPAGYVDRIFKGANPGDLPVEQPTKFDLVINAKTAKALGITLPQSIRLRADKVIE